MNRFAALIFASSLAFSNGAFAIGAIAVDDQMGDDEPAYGFATGEDSKEAAFKAAIKYCKEYGGKNCRGVVWFESCGAVAVSKKYYGYGYGKTKAVATARALEMCGQKSCNVVVAECE